MTKLENDRENEVWFPNNIIKYLVDVDYTKLPIKSGYLGEFGGYVSGEHSKHRLIRKRYERQVWVVLALIVAVTLILSR